jgi:hypothetical protein
MAGFRRYEVNDSEKGNLSRCLRSQSATISNQLNLTCVESHNVHPASTLPLDMHDNSRPRLDIMTVEVENVSGQGNLGHRSPPD